MRSRKNSVSSEIIVSARLLEIKLVSDFVLSIKRSVSLISFFYTWFLVSLPKVGVYRFVASSTGIF